MRTGWRATVVLLACGAATLAAFAVAAGARAHPCPPTTPAPPGTPGNVVEQAFPPGEPAQTAWRVRFGHATGKGLYVTGAWFRKSPEAPWMRVLWDARVADIFVPYHSGSPRYYDLTNFSFGLVPAGPADAGACGRIVDGKVIVEVRPRGLLWKDDQGVRHGHELVLWATLDSANYNYVMRYAFQDDGTVALRLGATSRNLPGAEYEGHMHDALWRIDIDLDGFTSDTALLARHGESTAGLAATDELVPFNGGREGWADWNPLEFTELHVRDRRVNAQRRHIAYDFRPVRMGTARHFEDFAHHDFWVTRYRPTETTYKLVPSYVNNESVRSTDVVVWHMSPLHHAPRDEDGFFDGPFWKGVALLMWGGVDLRPRNLFDRTPFFP